MIELAEFLDRPIAFHRAFVRLGVGISGALFLSQAIYWSRRTQRGDGWFYKTQADWEEETGMTRYEQEGARKKLRALGVLAEVKRGVPCKTFYKVDFSQLSMRLLQYVENQQTGMRKTSEQGRGNPPSKAGENQRTITENTQRLPETTTENTLGDPLESPAEKTGGSKKKRAADKYTLSGMDMSSWPSQPADQVLSDWLEVRKANKAPITQTAITRIGNQLRIAVESGYTVDQCLSLAIERGWRGFEAAWMTNHQGGGGKMQPARRQGRSEQVDYSSVDYSVGIDEDGRF